MEKALTLLGIESSCDDTAAAVVRLTPEGRAEVLANVVAGQTALHEAYGGVVPEIAARAHVEKLDISVAEALRQVDALVTELQSTIAAPRPRVSQCQAEAS